MKTIEKIILILKNCGPMTVWQIAREAEMKEKSIACAIWRSRSSGGGIRVCGALKTQNTPYLYEASFLPDVTISKVGCVGKPVHRRTKMSEDQREKRQEMRDLEKRRQATVVVVRRDPMDVFLFGEYRRAACTAKSATSP
jgi:hypothetical protein